MNLCGRPAQRITQLRVACAGEHSRLSTAAEGKSLWGSAPSNLRITNSTQSSVTRLTTS
jgi:hypothetical protein